MQKNSTTELKFLKSALTVDNQMNSVEDCVEWLGKRRKLTRISIKPIKFADLKDWYFDDETGNLHHKTGRFFTIEGLSVRTKWQETKSWSQPIIDQPEIGILGIIVKLFEGTLHFLMQAKIEPGNINYVQLSPTLQATKSNYTRVHKGKTPDYL